MTGGEHKMTYDTRAERADALRRKIHRDVARTDPGWASDYWLPKHLVFRLAAFTDADGVLYWDSSAKGGSDGYEGRMVVVTETLCLVADIHESAETRFSDGSSTTLRAYRLRDATSITLAGPDAGWPGDVLGTGALTLNFPAESVSLPIGNMSGEPLGLFVEQILDACAVSGR